MKSTKENLLVHLSGITKKSIREAIQGDQTKVTKIERFLYGDIAPLIIKSFDCNSGSAIWASYAKRCVQVMEARTALQFYLRNSIKPQNKNVLVLSGPDPDKACIPWAISGLGTNFVAYESNRQTFQLATNNLKKKASVLNKKSLVLWQKVEDVKINLEIRNENCLCPSQLDRTYSVIDLDFCNNKLRTEQSTLEINDVVSEMANKEGITVFRTTLHIGRIDNSWNSVSKDIDYLEILLKYTGFRIREKTENRYISTLPMVSVMWILER